MPKYDLQKNTKGANIIEVIDSSPVKLPFGTGTRVIPKKILGIENIFTENRRVQGNLKKSAARIIEELICADRQRDPLNKPKKELSPKITHIKKFGRKPNNFRKFKQNKIENI
jgi:hypothetical protein